MSTIRGFVPQGNAGYVDYLYVGYVDYLYIYFFIMYTCNLQLWYLTGYREISVLIFDENLPTDKL